MRYSIKVEPVSPEEVEKTHDDTDKMSQGAGEAGQAVGGEPVNQDEENAVKDTTHDTRSTDLSLKEKTRWPLGYAVVAAVVGCLLLLLESGGMFAAGWFFRPASAPVQVASRSPDLQPNLDNLAGAVQKQQESVKGLATELTKLKESGVKIPKDFAQEVAEKVNVPNPVLPVGALTQKEAEELRKSIEKLASKGNPAPPPPGAPTGPVLTKAERDALLADIRNTVREAAPPGVAAVSNPALARDVYLIISHNSALDATHYVRALSTALTKTVGRQKDGPVRVGLLKGSAGVLTQVVGLDAVNVTEDMVKNDIGDKLQDATESPQLWGDKIQVVSPSGRAKRRGVLIVSTDCKPPSSDDGWKDLSDTHIVLIARRDIQADQFKTIFGWHKFAAMCKGTVHVIDKDDNSKQNDQLGQQLKLLIEISN